MPENSHVEALTPVVQYLDGTFREVLKIKWGHKVGPWSIGLVSLSLKDPQDNIMYVSFKSFFVF